MGILDDAGDAALVARVKQEVADALPLRKSTARDPAPEEALQHVFV